ncbi:MAG: hypothetical protein V2I47_07290 [Bacteroidales bacterium]|jgi:hypothetical protein|nr:hypothetical protein [Bacteroidales bacterium]
MIQFRHAFLINLVLLILTACSKQDIDPEQQGLVYKSAISVPFKGMIEVSVFQVIHQPPPPPLEQLVHGEGKVSHLGKTRVTLNQFWWPPEFPGDPGTGEGRVFFSAANGDILLAEYEDGVAYQLSPASMEITFTGYFKDGGSGRFQYASGWFTWKETYNPITNEGTSIVNGVISYGREPF